MYVLRGDSREGRGGRGLAGRRPCPGGDERSPRCNRIEAYYDEGTKRLSSLVERYGVDIFLVSDETFDATTYQRVWNRDFRPFTAAVRAQLARRRRYALQDLARDCAAVVDDRVALVPATCLKAR